MKTPLSQEALQQKANAIISVSVVEKLRSMSATQHLRLAYGGLSSTVETHEKLVERGATEAELQSTVYATFLMRAYGILAGRASQVELPPVVMSSADAPTAHDVLGEMIPGRYSPRPDHVVDATRLDAVLDTGRIACQLEVRTDRVTRLVWVDVRQAGDLLISLPLASLMTVADGGHVP